MFSRTKTKATDIRENKNTSKYIMHMHNSSKKRKEQVEKMLSSITFFQKKQRKKEK
jgi:hypothetical protein